MRVHTKNGYDFFAVASLLQKSLRRGDVVLASRAVSELLPKFANYIWNRLLVVSAEDNAGALTGEVIALYLAWCKLNDDRPRAQRYAETQSGRGPAADLGGMRKGSRMFFMKAVVLLAKSKHSRDADELALLVSDRVPDEVFEKALAQIEKDDDMLDEIPEWVYDMHTARGRRMGASREAFLRAEHDALVNTTSMFINFDEMVSSWGDEYVEPELGWDE